MQRHSPAEERHLGPERETALGPEAWSAYLTRELGAPVEVIFTRARRTVLRLEPRGRTRSVRMNGFFAHAPVDVRAAVVSWIRSGRRARRKLELLDAWIEVQIEAVERAAPRRVRLVTQGRVHDLERIAGELREEHFAGVFTPGGLEWPRLTWGRAPRSRSRRTLRLGSFDVWSGVVRMHPVLDQAGVPESFVRYVLFHEILHAALPAERGHAGRRVFHSAEFKRRERAYPGTAAALVWEKVHLAELLWSARTGKEMRTGQGVGLVGRGVAAMDRAEPKSGERGWLRIVQRFLFD